MTTAAQDLLDLDFWSRPMADRHAEFARLRAAREPAFYPYGEAASGLTGFYALTRYDEVVEASRNPAAFSSEPSSTSLDDPPPATAGLLGSMISLDDPRHARLRRIVSRAFTPRMIKKAEGQVAVIAERLVRALAERGSGDFVTDVAMPMPLQIICSMMGVPEPEHAAVIDATNSILAVGDPGFRSPDGRDRGTILVEKLGYLHSLMDKLAQQRRAEPADDLVSALVHANIDGEMLSDQDLARFFTLLVVAGNETTRNAISHSLAFFTEHPGQRALLLEDLGGRLPGAVEEIIRYASPVTWMRRNVTRDVDLGGHTYHAGDRVVLYYVSANRDETVFAAPDRFDITRSPNPHVGFGGPGPHFCLGAHLARREIIVLLSELFSRLPDIHATAEPQRQRASFINGIANLPCSTT